MKKVKDKKLWKYNLLLFSSLFCLWKQRQSENSLIGFLFCPWKQQQSQTSLIISSWFVSEKCSGVRPPYLFPPGFSLKTTEWDLFKCVPVLSLETAAESDVFNYFLRGYLQKLRQSEASLHLPPLRWAFATSSDAASPPTTSNMAASVREKQAGLSNWFYSSLTIIFQR